MEDPAKPQTLLLRIVNSVTHCLIASPRDSKALLPRLVPRAIFTFSANLPSPTQQACPLIPSCKLASSLLATSLTLLAYHFRIVVAVVVVFVVGVGVVVGGVAVGAGGGEGHRQCIGRCSA